MPLIVSSIHDPLALTATCRRLNLPAPQHGCIQLGDQEVSGWIVRLPGVLFPIVCDLLTGLVAYHPRDNAFGRYGRIMRFIFRTYDVRHQLQTKPATRRPTTRRLRRPALVGR